MPTPFLPFLRAFARILLLPLLLMLAGTGAFAQTNGGFETGDLTGWTKVIQQTDGLSIPSGQPLTYTGPFSGNSIQVRPGGSGVDKTSVLGPFAYMTQTDANAPSLKFPMFGQHCAVVNLLGNNANMNRLTQTFTLDSTFRDTAGDNKLHLRFAFAPVLQSGGHNPWEQPFFYIGVRNVSKANALIYDNLNFTDQPGAPWLVNGTVYYTLWQTQDVVLPESYLGDSLQLEFTAAGCPYTAHWGHVYVDSMGATIQGLWVSGVADKTVAAQGDPLQYTISVRNNSGQTQHSVNFTAVLPADLNYVGNSQGLVWDAGTRTLSGSIPDLLDGGIHAFTVSTTIANPASQSSVLFGNYKVHSTEQPDDLFGALVTTNLTGPSTNLGVAMTSAIVPSAYRQVQYTITVTNGNAGSDNAATNPKATFTLPANATLVSAVSSGGTTPIGAGPVTVTWPTLAKGASETMTIVVLANDGNPVTGSVHVAGDFSDPDSSNDDATSTTNQPAPLSIATNPVGGGYLNSTIGGPTVNLTVATSGGWGPASYQWYRGNAGDTSTPVGSNSATYTVPTNVDGTFSYWVRASDAGGSVDSQAASITVFSTHDITTATIGNGTISPSGVVPVIHGQDQTFTITAGYCYYILDVKVDGVSQGPFAPKTVFTYNYTFTNVTTTHTITATFSINTYALLYTANANGYISGVSPQVVNCGSNGTQVEAIGTPGSTYTFWRWSDGSTFNPRTDTNVLANLSVSATFATQEEEPNDNFVQATPVSGPGLCVGRVNPANGLLKDPSDYYRIVLPHGSTLSATLVPPANGLRYYFYIYNQMGRVMAQSTTIGGVANTAIVKNTTGSTLYYYVAVRTTSGASASYYELTLNW